MRTIQIENFLKHRGYHNDEEKCKHGNITHQSVEQLSIYSMDDLISTKIKPVKERRRKSEHIFSSWKLSFYRQIILLYFIRCGFHTSLFSGTVRVSFIIVFVVFIPVCISSAISAVSVFVNTSSVPACLKRIETCLVAKPAQRPSNSYSFYTTSLIISVIVSIKCFCIHHEMAHIMQTHLLW